MARKVYSFKPNQNKHSPNRATIRTDQSHNVHAEFIEIDELLKGASVVTSNKGKVAVLETTVAVLETAVDALEASNKDLKSKFDEIVELLKGGDAPVGASDVSQKQQSISKMEGEGRN